MKLYRIKRSKIDKKGRGLYATRDIKEGTKIINYVGKIITSKEVDESIKFDNKISVGPEKNASQATKANGLIFLLNGFTITWPSAQIADPKIVNKIPKNFPSKFGEPVKIYTPIKAIKIPIRDLIVGFSLSKK